MQNKSKPLGIEQCIPDRLGNPPTFNIVGLSEKQLEEILFALSDEDNHPELSDILWEMYRSLPNNTEL